MLAVFKCLNQYYIVNFQRFRSFPLFFPPSRRYSIINSFAYPSLSDSGIPSASIACSFVNVIFFIRFLREKTTPIRNPSWYPFWYLLSTISILRLYINYTSLFKCSILLIKSSFRNFPAQAKHTSRQKASTLNRSCISYQFFPAWNNSRLYSFISLVFILLPPESKDIFSVPLRLHPFSSQNGRIVLRFNLA